MATRFVGPGIHLGHDRLSGESKDLADANALVCQLNRLVEREVAPYRADCFRYRVDVAVINLQTEQLVAVRQFPYPDDWLSIACPKSPSEEENRRPPAPGAFELRDEIQRGNRRIG